MYERTCPVCGGYHLPNLADSGPFDGILDALAEKLYNEKVSKGTIDHALYRQTAGELMKALEEGLGGASFELNDSRNTLKAYLEQNIYAFSAAKSLTEYEHFRSLMTDAEGNIRSFTDFRNAVLDAGYQFNVNWLRTEYETASASAQMAFQWEQLKHNDYLEYSTVGDDRVRPAHAALDGLTLLAASPVWNRIWPPNDWNCRCTVIPGIASKATTDETAGPIGKQAVTNPYFEKNVGKDKVIYDNGHPYYNKVPKELDAVKNYGLRKVSKIYADEDQPLRIESASEAEYRQWWAGQRKVPGTDDIVLKDKSGLHILFDSVDTPGNSRPYEHFKDHILQKSNEQRWKYAANFPDTINDPDEVWSQRQNNKITRFYIKYYDNAPYAVVVADKAGKLVAESMYELTKARVSDLRRGVLIYAKK